MMPKAQHGHRGAFFEALSNSRDEPDSSYPFAFVTVNARMERILGYVAVSGAGAGGIGSFDALAVS